MVADTKKSILGYIQINKQARVYDLVRVFHLSRAAIHRQLNRLIKEGEVIRVGKPPLVFYVLNESKPEVISDISDQIKRIIEERYLYVSPVGEAVYGFEGFSKWVIAIKQERKISDLALEYTEVLQSFKKYISKEGWVDATKKLEETFSEVYIDKLLYGDFYSLPKFGKTKLGQLVLYSKQSQNLKLIQQVSLQIKPQIEEIIQKFSINAVGFVPPTVPRNIQFMKELERNLELSLPKVNLVKSSVGEIIVPQKTLSRLEERVTNARETIYIKEKDSTYKNILLIDDAAGSGATLNETAKKLKSTLAKEGKIIAFAIVGSIKGFEVIREI